MTLTAHTQMKAERNYFKLTKYRGIRVRDSRNAVTKSLSTRINRYQEASILETITVASHNNPNKPEFPYDDPMFPATPTYQISVPGFSNIRLKIDILTRQGVDVEPSGAAGLALLLQIQNEVPRDEKILIVSTGKTKWES